MRIAVTIYLVLATAVGPRPCCCALPGSACRAAAPGSTAANGPPACCHGGKTRPAESSFAGAARVADGERPAGGQNRPTCPCGEQGCAAKARPDQARPTTSHSQSCEPSAACGWFVAYVPTVAVAGTAGGNRVSGSVADPLNGHRVLRC